MVREEIDTEFLMGFKASLLTEPGVKASAEEGSGKPLSARTVAKILTLVGTVFRYGKRIKLVADNPASEVRKPKAAKKAVYILEPEEIARLRAALDVPFERLLVELTITTGLRSGEIRGLVWDAVDLTGKRLFVERQATRRRDDGHSYHARDLYLHDETSPRRLRRQNRRSGRPLRSGKQTGNNRLRER
jgi:integrase